MWLDKLRIDVGGNLEQRNCCVCVDEEEAEIRGPAVILQTHSAVIVVVFLHDKVFCQYLLRTPRFLLLSLKLVKVFYISVKIHYRSDLAEKVNTTVKIRIRIRIFICHWVKYKVFTQRN